MASLCLPLRKTSSSCAASLARPEGKEEAARHAPAATRSVLLYTRLHRPPMASRAPFSRCAGHHAGGVLHGRAPPPARTPRCHAQGASLVPPPAPGRRGRGAAATARGGRTRQANFTPAPQRSRPRARPSRRGAARGGAAAGGGRGRHCCAAPARCCSARCCGTPPRARAAAAGRESLLIRQLLPLPAASPPPFARLAPAGRAAGGGGRPRARRAAGGGVCGTWRRASRSSSGVGGARPRGDVGTAGAACTASSPLGGRRLGGQVPALPPLSPRRRRRLPVSSLIMRKGSTHQRRGENTHQSDVTGGTVKGIDAANQQQGDAPPTLSAESTSWRS